MNKLLFSSLLLSTALIHAENLAVTSAPESIALTVYANDMAMVSEKRSAAIDHPGKVKLMYPGVPSAIDTSSVIAIFDQPVKLFSQNYSYDVISFDSLLKYHLGKSVHYTENKKSVERKEGMLLSESPILIQEKDQGAIYTPYQLFFPTIPKEMAVKPSLFWNIETQSPKLAINLKYLTTQMSWKSDYTLDLGTDGTLGLNAWITITNNSGATYNDADITVLAGEVNKPQTQEADMVYAKHMMAAAPMERGTIQNEPFSGYHIYHIPFSETIKDKEQKQISFIEKKAIPFVKYALNEQMDYLSNFGERNLQFDQVIEFKNSQKNHLGIPLPKGTVRVYDKDEGGISRFVGANTIDNTPKDEDVKLMIGKYFDIVGKERVTAFRTTREEKHITYEITISNHSKKSEVIKLKKSVPANRGKLTIKDSCDTHCSKEVLNAFSTRYTFSLKPEETYHLTLSYDMKVY